MKKEFRKTKTFISLLILSLFSVVTDSYSLAETNKLADKQLIESPFEAKVKPIEFSSSKEYDRERHIVRKIKDMAESEKYSAGAIKKATIRIAIEDINNDGIKEILSYIVQSEWCSGNGRGCTFLVLQKNGVGKWEKLFETLTNENIGILATKNDGYHDLIFKDSIADSQKKEELLWIWRWDGQQYNPYMKRRIIYDFVTKVEKLISWRWDLNSKSWNIVGEYK